MSHFPLQGWGFAGTQSSTVCVCGSPSTDVLLENTEHNSCNLPCIGDLSQPCGGEDDIMSVFAKGNKYTCTLW